MLKQTQSLSKVGINIEVLKTLTLVKHLGTAFFSRPNLERNKFKDFGFSDIIFVLIVMKFGANFQISLFGQIC